MGRIWVLALALAGCTAIDVATVNKLNQLDPIEADPAEFEIIAHLPKGLELVPESARLKIEASNGSDSLVEKYLLDQVAENGRYSLSLTDEDVARMRELQTEARAWEEQSPDDTKGSLGVDVGVCLRDDGPDLQEPVSIDISVGSFGILPLLHPIPAELYLQELKSAGQPVGPCLF